MASCDFLGWLGEDRQRKLRWTAYPMPPRPMSATRLPDWLHLSRSHAAMSGRSIKSGSGKKGMVENSSRGCDWLGRCSPKLKLIVPPRDACRAGMTYRPPVGARKVGPLIAGGCGRFEREDKHGRGLPASRNRCKSGRLWADGCVWGPQLENIFLDN